MGVLVAVACSTDKKLSQNGIVEAGNARFTVITPELIRIEYSEKGLFEDRPTFTVQNRVFDSVPQYSVNSDDEFLYINTDKLNLKYRKDSNPFANPGTPENLSITMNLNNEPVVWYPGLKDSLNLKGTTRTLDRSQGDNKRSEMEDGVISRSGWAIIDDSPSAVRPDGSHSFPMEYNEELGYDWWAEPLDPESVDLYFFGYGKDYKRAVGDYIKLAGKIPLPPDYVFGYWYSKYASYSADDYRQIMKDIKENGIPADVMILDMDWHWNGSEESFSKDKGGWTGWSWNTNLIPEPEALLAEIHDNNFKIALNLHPADGIAESESPVYFNEMKQALDGKYIQGDTIKYSLDFPDFTKAFFNSVIRDHEREGVDFWWLDWQQHLTSPYTEGLGETFWNNHVFFNDMIKNRPDHRPVIFHRWGGLGSHRYQIGFSGDANINFPTLAFQPYFTSTASNVGYTYWGHDLGGHNFTTLEEINDPELVLRWIQFGVFTPIFRTHATKERHIERRVWKYSNFPDMLEAIKLRYALFPYYYTMARETYDTGIGMVRPLYYEYPDNEEAYDYEGEYFFGNDILVAPITEASANGKTTSKEIWFPEGKWWSPAKKIFIEGPRVETLDFAMNEIPYFYKQGSVTPLNPPTVMNVTERPDHMILNVISGADGEFSFYEDAGDNSDYANVYATTKFNHTFNNDEEIITINPRQGSDKGLSQSRSWLVNVYGSQAPSSISINGKQLPDTEWTYKASDNCISINVPSKDCREESKIVVSYKK